MKVIAIKIHQAVRIGTALESYLTTRGDAGQTRGHHRGLDMNWIPQLGAVAITAEALMGSVKLVFPSDIIEAEVDKDEFVSAMRTLDPKPKKQTKNEE